MTLNLTSITCCIFVFTIFFQLTTTIMPCNTNTCYLGVLAIKNLCQGQKTMEEMINLKNMPVMDFQTAFA